MRRIADLPSVATFVRVWPFLKQEKGKLLVVAAVTLGLTAVELSVPVMVGAFVDSLLGRMGNERPTPTLWGLGNRGILILLAVAAVARGFLFFQQRALAGKVGQRVAARMRDAVWSHLQRLPMEYSRRRGQGRLLVRFISDARAVQRLVSRGVVQLAQDALTVVGVLAVLLYMDLLMGLVMAGVVPVVGGIFWYLNPRLQDASRDMRRRRSRMSAHLSGRIKGLEVVKSYGNHDSEARQVKKLNRNVVKHGNRREVAGGALLGASAGAVALVTVLALALAGNEVAAGRLTAGELVTFYTLVGLLAPVFQRITVVDRTLQEAQISMQRLSETLAKPVEGEPEGEVLPDLVITEGTVRVEGLAYAHDDGEPLLDDVGFVARRGELVVLTGPNGSGKSTVLEILTRFQEPDEGSVTVDGQDVSGVSLDSLRTRVNLVTQDTPVFDGTVRENVAYGAASGEAVTEERLEEVARLTGLDELLEGLPDGWETRIREGRRDISDGQRQRVSLARALVADPDVLLLDGAASAVDEDTLRGLVRGMREISPEKTIIIATHRLPVLLEADRIYVIRDGRTFEVSPEALRERHESNGTNGEASIFAGLLPERAPAGERRPVRTATRTRNREDEDEDDE